MVIEPIIDDAYEVDTYTNAFATKQVLQAVVPEFASGAWELLGYEVTQVRKQRKKRIVFARVTYRDDVTTTADIITKVYGDHKVRSLDALQRVWHAGFQPPSVNQVPRPYGYSAEHGVLFQGQAFGSPWAAFLSGNKHHLATVSAQGADWLVQLHESDVPADVQSWQADVGALQRFARELSAQFPAYAEQIDSVAHQLASCLDATAVPLVPTHGDYHPRNVFMARGITMVIDFDTLALREAAFDVGYCIGQLLIMSYFMLGEFGPGAYAARAFWRQYAQRSNIGWERVAAQIARTLLQSLHYELCTMRNNRVDLLSLWLSLMAQALYSTHPSMLLDTLVQGEQSL